MFKFYFIVANPVNGFFPINHLPKLLTTGMFALKAGIIVISNAVLINQKSLL